MGVMDFLKHHKNPISSLNAQRAAAKNVLSRAFNNPGPLFNSARKAIIEKWIKNFIRNLDAAVTAIQAGQGMNGLPISRADIGSGLVRICNEYSRPEVLMRLEEVCGPECCSSMKEVIDNVRSIAGLIR